MLDGDKSDLTDDTDGAMDMDGREVVGRSKYRFDYIRPN
jgi:hypothetical protein